MPGKIWFILLLGMSVFACTTSRNTESLNRSDSSFVAINDSLFVDSLNYVDFIYKFPKTGEFYSALYFAENFDYRNYDNVAALGDEVVYHDTELKRTIIPLERAKPFFNLTGSSEINIFNRKNQVVGKGKLLRIEYVEDLLEAKFVAVFDVANADSIKDFTYCIGSGIDRFDSVRWTPVNNELLTRNLVDYLQVNPDRSWSVHHYEIQDAGVLYSAVSTDTTAYVIETVDQRINILYKSKFSQAIRDLIILPKYISGKPVLLISCEEPETDITWSSLLVFLGDQYEVAADHRLRD